MAEITAINEAYKFLGMLGPIDYKHWKWKNSPTEWAGKYQGYKGKPIIIQEAVTTQDIWFWYAFFGTLERNNDINVLWN